MKTQSFFFHTCSQAIGLFRNILHEPFRLGDKPVERIPMILSYLAMFIWVIRFFWVLSLTSEPVLSFEMFYPSAYTYSIYLFLPWNLFLAWIPFAISRWLYPDQSGLFFWPILLVWLLFLPNAPYLITDFIHFGQTLGVPMFLELLTFGSFAAAGIALGSYSLFHIHYCLSKRLSVKKAWSIVPIVLLLSAVGIFIGRVIRFNSWDAFTNPIEVIAVFVEFLSEPEYMQLFLAFSSLCFAFLFLCYLLVYFSRRQLMHQKDL